MFYDLFGAVLRGMKNTGGRNSVPHTRKQIFELAESELLAIENEPAFSLEANGAWTC